MLITAVFLLCSATSAILNENKSWGTAWSHCGRIAPDRPGYERSERPVRLAPGRSLSSRPLILSLLTQRSSPLRSRTSRTQSQLLGCPAQTRSCATPPPQAAASDDQPLSTSPSGWVGTSAVPEASIRFGFPVRSYLECARPRSLKGDTSFKFSLSDNMSTDLK